MIRIQRASEVEADFFSPRDFEATSDVVRQILADVSKRGDEALREYGEKFDVAVPANFEISHEDLKACAEKLQRENPKLYDAICYSHDLALRFAKKQCECFSDFEIELESGLFTGQKNIAVERAGVYVPAGRFPLVSTVIMTATPAKAAGVGQVIMCTPPRVHPKDANKSASAVSGSAGKVIGGLAYADEGIMAAAYICGVDKVFAVGGAQAVAALAYGTQTIPAVDVIVGPGNKFVAEAKKIVYGRVGIDMIAGPTEVFIIADKSANPAWVAADLLAQAEHDVVAQPVLATNSETLANAVAEEIEKQLGALATAETARASIENCGRIILTDSLEQAAEFANRKAPEHLELAMDAGTERDKIESFVHNYGSLFIGHESAEVLGDYAAGLNHTLPTSGSARFTGGLSVRCFLKTVTTLRTAENAAASNGASASGCCSTSSCHLPSGVKKSAEVAGLLGDAEGLSAHANAARVRLY